MEVKDANNFTTCEIRVIEIESKKNIFSITVYRIYRAEKTVDY